VRKSIKKIFKSRKRAAAFSECFGSKTNKTALCRGGENAKCRSTAAFFVSRLCFAEDRTFLFPVISKVYGALCVSRQTVRASAAAPSSRG
jgi:hypothetical protein